MKALLFVVAMCINSTIEAQITLTAGGVAGPGTFYKEYYGDTSIDPGPAGANKIWNYSSFVKLDSGAGYFIACASTPWCASFPGATTAVTPGYGFYYYTALSSTSYSGRGWYDSSSGETGFYNDPRDIIRLPLTYNNSYVETWASIASTAGVTYKQSGLDSVKADAWGKLMLPNAVYNDVLRVRTVAHIIDSVVVGGVQTLAGTRREESYVWYALNRAPLLTSVTSTSSLSGGMTITSGHSSYTSQPFTSVQKAVVPEISLQIFPAPAHEELQVSFNNKEPMDIRVSLTDMFGRVIIDIPASAYSAGRHLLKLNTSHLSKGVYVLTVNGESGAITRKVEVN